MVGALFLIGLAVVIGVAIVVSLTLGFRSLDPGRARAAATVGPDGTFLLEFPNPDKPADVYFRFHVSGDIDLVYENFSVGAEILVDGNPVGRIEVHHGSHSRELGYATPTWATTLYATTARGGSIGLAKVPRGERCVVRGVALPGGRTTLDWGIVYVP